LHTLEPMNEQGQVINAFRSGLDLIQLSCPLTGMTDRIPASLIIRKLGRKMAER
jgi:hypothetical protein